MNHYGLNRALQSFDDLHKQADDVKRHIEFLQSNMAGMPVGVSPFPLLISIRDHLSSAVAPANGTITGGD